MFGFIKDPFGHWGNMPEVPEPKYFPEDDPTAEHLMGCMYSIGFLIMIVVILLLLYVFIR